MSDVEVLRSICQLCKEADKNIQYGLANLVVNLTNSYDVPEITEEQEQLKKIGESEAPISNFLLKRQFPISFSSLSKEKKKT